MAALDVRRSLDWAMVTRIILPSVVMFLFFALAIFLGLLPFIEQRLMAQKQLVVQGLVDAIHADLNHHLAQEQSGNLTHEEAQQHAADHIRSLRYGPEGKDYFWINDLDVRMIVHPYRPDLEGTDVNTFEDPKGKRLFVECVETVRANGAGYVEYMWQWKDDPTRIVPKISYVKLFEPWGWVIGTGIYVEDVREDLAGTRRALAGLCAAILLATALLCTYLARQAYAIEARRQGAERSLRDSEERFRALTEHSVDTIMRFDRNHRHLYVNPAVEEETGISPEAFLGKTHHELGFPDHLVQLWDETIEKVFEEGKRQRAEFCLPSGKWVDWILMPEFDPDGEVSAVVTAARDITERKTVEESLRQSEEEYRYLVENANSIVLRMNREGRVTFFNEFAQEFFGFAPEEILGRSVVGTIVPETSTSGEDLARMIREIGLCPEQYATNENENMRRDGERVWVSWTNKALRDENGEVLEMLCVGNDITTRRRLEDQLRQSQKMEAIGALAGGIAHDFNNLLWAIIGNIEIVMMDELPEEHPARHSLREAHGAATQAKELVAQILLFSRQQEETRQPVAFNVLLRETMRLLRSTLPSTMEIALDLSSEPDVVLGDPAQLRQVVMNLCTNAAHAMRKEGGELTLHSENVHLGREDIEGEPGIEPGEFVRLVVKDTGEGIPSRIADRIFEPYFTTKSVGEGTGLGLAVVHGIVRKLGGTMHFKSKVGRGTEFTVLLPLADVEAHEQQVIEEAPPRGCERILIVDDQENVLEMLSRLLSKLGYEVTARSDGVEALIAFDENPDAYDLVVTDMTMPGMTGDVLAGALLERRPDLPVILCTGYSERLEPDMCQRVGVRETVMKPVTGRDLSKAIRRALDAV